MTTPDVPIGDQWRASQPTATMSAVTAPAATDSYTAASNPARPATRVKARKARLVLGRIDPWSVMKLAFLLSLAGAVVAIVAMFVLWSVLDTIGVFTSVGQTVEKITRSSDTAKGVNILDYIGLSRVMSVTVALSVVNLVLMTALATLTAFLYNLAASLVGGLHVTFTEDV